MDYTRFKRNGDIIEVIGVIPNRGLLATIDTSQGHRVSPTHPLTELEWQGLDVYLKFSVGLKKRARRTALAARWGDSAAFLEALWGLPDPRGI